MLREVDLEQRRAAAAADAERHSRRAAALDTERARLACATARGEVAMADHARVWAAEELQLAATADSLSAVCGKVRRWLAVRGARAKTDDI